tara:strand:- start:552 stop:1421 length:870 start_codon:yes stop_codon:yes gene_type:complete
MKVDFFIVGAPKAGTTSLYHYLDKHPEINMSSEKEPNYFSNDELEEQGMYYGKPRINKIEMYHSLFAKHRQFKLRGEGSVSYLFYKNVPAKIKEYNPKAKIIIMLRNPVDRAFSHYLMDRRLGLVHDSFEDVINKKSVHKDAKLFYQQYIQVGEYANQVKRYLEHFDRNDILFVNYDELKEDVTVVIQNTYSFLGLDMSYRANLEKKHNTYTMPKNNIIRFIYSFVSLRKTLSSLLPKSLIRVIRLVLFRADKKPKLLKETREKLKLLFKQDINELSKILDKDLSSWLK